MNTNCFIYPRRKEETQLPYSPAIHSRFASLLQKIMWHRGPEPTPTKIGNKALMDSGGSRIKPRVANEQKGRTPSLLPAALLLFLNHSRRAAGCYSPEPGFVPGIHPAGEKLSTVPS